MEMVDALEMIDVAHGLVDVFSCFKEQFAAAGYFYGPDFQGSKLRRDEKRIPCSHADG